MTRTSTTPATAPIEDQEHELFVGPLLADDPAGLTAAIEELSANIRARVESWSRGAI